MPYGDAKANFPVYTTHQCMVAHHLTLPVSGSDSGFFQSCDMHTGCTDGQMHGRSKYVKCCRLPTALFI